MNLDPILYPDPPPPDTACTTCRNLHGICDTCGYPTDPSAFSADCDCPSQDHWEPSPCPDCEPA
jgi:hypothetical protein